MTKQIMTEFDLFFLSYNEPKKEQFWSDLLNIAPWAQRVDGVKGFDNAHKTCATQSTTQHFITVDGDNLIDPKFFEEQIDVEVGISYSWAARNFINGLIYGNGGIKLWDKDFVLKMKTHENCENQNEAVDFCWLPNYQQIYKIFSTTYPNGSPLQAFRAGFREGTKLILDKGRRIQPNKILLEAFRYNIQKVLVWASVGIDVQNGIWSMLGTRYGVFYSLDENWDISIISDYNKLDEFCVKHIENTKNTEDDLKTLGEKIKRKTNIPMTEFNSNQSELIKLMYWHDVRY